MCLKIIWSHLKLLKKILQNASQDLKFCKWARSDIVQARTPRFFLYCSPVKELSKTQKILGKMCHVPNIGPSPYEMILIHSFLIHLKSKVRWGSDKTVFRHADRIYKLFIIIPGSCWVTSTWGRLVILTKIMVLYFTICPWAVIFIINVTELRSNSIKGPAIQWSMSRTRSYLSYLSPT